MQQHTLSHSELIINNTGRIYHLDLHPEELATTVILVGDPDRVPLVSSLFDRLEVKRQHREFVSHTGYIRQKRISVVSTGIGTDNIDIVLNEIDALVNIDFSSRQLKEQAQPLQVIRLGTCGSVQAHIPVNSLVAATFAIGLDNLLHYYRYDNNAEETFLLHAFQQHTGLSGNPVQPYISEGSVRLRNHFMAGYLQGITVSCPGFYAPQGRRLRLPPAYPLLPEQLSSFSSGHHHIACFEMETSAIYGLGKLLGHHCISISLVVNNRATKTTIENLQVGLHNMIENSLAIIEGI